jgi:hypothetical protein
MSETPRCGPVRSISSTRERCCCTCPTARASSPEWRRGLLAPGGWLVLEEVDWLGRSVGYPSWSAALDALDRATPPMDWACGRELVHELAAAGLEVVEADADLDAIAGATPLAEWWRESIIALRPAVREAGTASDAEIDHQLARLQDPAFRALGLTWIGTTGRAA